MKKTIDYVEWVERGDGPETGPESERSNEEILDAFDVEDLKRGKRAPARARRRPES